MKQRCIFSFIILFSALIIHAAAVDGLDRWRAFAGTEDSRLALSWLRQVGRKILAGDSGIKEPCPVLLPEFFGSLGLFVTLLHEGAPRGCYGSFHHSSPDTAAVLRSCLRGALRYDPRVVPMALEEYGDARIIVTIAGRPVPVPSVDRVDIHDFGLMIVARDGRRMIFVPAEIRTHEYIHRLCGPVPIARSTPSGP
jgi:AMMECR1 domain-containing protein